LRILTTWALALIRLILGAILLSSVVLICANAFGRYVLAAPIIWAEEVLGYSLVWMVYLGAVLVTSDNGHLRMDLLTRMLPARWRWRIETIGNLIFLAIGALVIYQAQESITQFHFRSQVAGLPMDVLHTVVPVSFALMVVLVLAHIVRTWRHDPASDDQTPSNETAVS
jgi:TRAP-type C4-dicarboxylate transport system permease small subunit